MSILINRRAIRRDFISGYTSIDEVTEAYEEWYKWIFYILLYRFNRSIGKYEYAYFRGKKRGDPKYSYVICKKFDALKRAGKDLIFFSKKAHGLLKGSALLVTLEYNANKISRSEAWQNAGVDFNRFSTRLTHKYGKISIIRVLESHKSAYPHIHVLVIFHNHTFDGKRMWNKRKNKFSNRLFGQTFLSIKNAWTHGYSDFELVDSYQGGVKYLAKYLHKSTSYAEAGSKGIKTLAMCWLFNKRAYSYSGDLFDDEIVVHTNSTIKTNEENSETRKICVGMDLFNKKIYHDVDKWKLFGFTKRDGVLLGGGFGSLDPSCLVLTEEAACRVKNGFQDLQYTPYYDIIEKKESNVLVIDSRKYKKFRGDNIGKCFLESCSSVRGRCSLSCLDRLKTNYYNIKN